MRKLLAITLTVLSLSTSAQTIRHIEINPPPLDYDVLDRLWVYIKKQTNAPEGTPPPRLVLDWEVPIYASMGTQYPTTEHPGFPIQISIAPRTIDMWKPEMLAFGVGHEMAHYAFILRENNWDAGKELFVAKRLHHCDAEFIKITRGVANELWNMWHSDTLRNQMYDEVQKACANFPQQ